MCPGYGAHILMRKNIMPKYIGLAMMLRHLTRSKLLITMLNQFGHGSSYEQIERFDTKTAEKILAEMEKNGVVIPSEMQPGIFTHAAADNAVNRCLDTVDGNANTNVTSLIIMQNGCMTTPKKPITISQSSANVRRKTLKDSDTIAYQMQT
jgi:hypothetical protein